MSDYSKDTAQEALARDVGDTLRGLYKHYKGGLYIVFSESIDEATGEALVHYYSIERRTRWTRTVRNFTEKLLCEGGSEPVFDVPRFKRIREALDKELHLAAFDNGEGW